MPQHTPRHHLLAFGSQATIAHNETLCSIAINNIMLSHYASLHVLGCSLPTEYPVDMATNGNYCGIVFLGVALLSVLWYR
jgi:hypothetical protein